MEINAVFVMYCDYGDKVYGEGVILNGIIYREEELILNRCVLVVRNKQSIYGGSNIILLSIKKILRIFVKFR